MQNFFIQRPHIATLVPFTQEKQLTTSSHDYLWEQEPQHILDTLVQQYIETQLQSLLFQSLLAEHAARFISMDSSTRNAENLLEVNKLQYNKLRQAKITKELTELIGSF
jgi:F-type H+-transporting ATPase subunit gamma